jgi:uncharacterized protein (DUF697 family)
MTLMKSLLLGSAATLMVVAGAQAADLPTKKGAPAAEYVKVCKVGSIAGFIIPGTDTCLHITGFVTARYAFGSTNDAYSIVTATSLTSLGLSRTDGRHQNDYGDWTRGRLVIEAASNTAYGPLIAHMEPEMNYGHGFAFNNTAVADSSAVDKAWITWAGFTAGKHESFFSAPFFDAGQNSDMDLTASDTTVNLLAYTATFGGGFSATISMESPTGTYVQTGAWNTPTSVGLVNGYGYTYAPSADGSRAPDFVAALDVTQGWGSAHVAGVLHQINAEATVGSGSTAVLYTESTWGWGVVGGVMFNLPSLGAGADAKIVANYTEGDLGQSGVFNPWGNINLGGLGLNGPSSDVYFNYSSTGGSWEKSKAWTVAGGFDLPIGTNFKISPEASYAHVDVSLPTSSGLSANWSEWIGGGTFEWTPVHNLVFDLDLLYVSLHQAAPSGWAGTGVNAWKSNNDTFLGEFRVERDF